MVAGWVEEHWHPSVSPQWLLLLTLSALPISTQMGSRLLQWPLHPRDSHKQLGNQTCQVMLGTFKAHQLDFQSQSMKVAEQRQEQRQRRQPGGKAK